MATTLSRRQLVRAGALGAAALAADALAPWRVLERAGAVPAPAPGCGSLASIEHVVILINENRSFDSYFGTYRGVRGFADPHAAKLPGSGLSVFAQPFPGPSGVPYGGHLLPFHFDTDTQ